MAGETTEAIRQVVRSMDGEWTVHDIAKMIPGANVYAGRQHSLHAAVDGRVVFERKGEDRVHVTVQPVAQAAE